MPYILDFAGVDKSFLGIVIGFRACLEVAVMSLTGLIRRKLSLPAILTVSGLLYAAEHFLYGFTEGKGLASLLAIAILSGVAGGLFYSMGPTYLRFLVPADLKNSAHMMAGAAQCTVAIAGTLYAGMLIENSGISAMTRLCAAVILGLTAVFAGSLWIGVKVLKLKTPEAVTLPQNREAVS